MIFISFLGIGNYSPCNYFYKEIFCRKETTYIQNAIRSLFTDNIERSLLFVTEESKKKHLTQLQKEAEEPGLPPVEVIIIPPGSSEEQLWQIFTVISTTIPENAEIIFDITHSFRSLPLLMTILLNYLETAKGITNIQCYYGAFDAGQSRGESKDVPIFSLTPFFSLNEWTRAIHDFTNYGQTKQLILLIEKELRPIFRNPDQKSNAVLFRKMSLAIHDFSNYIHTANCHELCRMDFRERISDRLKILNDPGNPLVILPLTPIMKKIEEVFFDYENSSLYNGLRAARWCADLNLIPQGLTILQEVIVSLELEKNRKKLMAAGIEDAVRLREFISNLLGLSFTTPCKEWEGDLKLHLELAKDISSKWEKDFLSLYSRITQCRNSVNHGGTNPSSHIAKNVGEKLSTFVDQAMIHYKIKQ